MGHIYLSRPIPKQFMPVPSHGIPITYNINMEYNTIKIIKFMKV